jgi:hypothetical protein
MFYNTSTELHFCLGYTAFHSCRYNLTFTLLLLYIQYCNNELRKATLNRFKVLTARAM